MDQLEGVFKSCMGVGEKKPISCSRLLDTKHLLPGATDTMEQEKERLIWLWLLEPGQPPCTPHGPHGPVGK